MCMCIIVILIIGFAAQDKGQMLPEGSTNRVTECEGTILRGSCPANQVMAVKDIQYGTTNCALNANDPGCCDYDPSDCLTNYTGTTQQAACSGRELCNDVTIGEEDTSSCGFPYPDLNHYLTMEYYCIPESRIAKICDSASLTATGSPLYIWNNDYPAELIRAATPRCSCSVEASSCNSKVKVYFVHFELGDGGGSCSGNQNIQIDDKGSTETYSCSHNNNYEIITKITSSSNYITVTLDNAMAISDGKFWIGFEATENTAQLQIDCPARAHENCKDCSALDYPTYGTVTVPSTIYQSVATFSCNTGYTLVGSATRECQIDGTWSNENPTCFINDCGSLSAPGNGMVTYSSGTIFQSVATFSCDTGYALVGDATRTCQADKSWSNSDPSCQINDCGSLHAPANGSVIYSNRTTFQSVATFSCDTGHTLVGDATRTCQADESWSNMDPSCQINDCGSLSAPANGSVTYAGGTTFQSVATFGCDTGYTLVGDATRTCQAYKSWSNNNPSCQINDCNDPINVGYMFGNVAATIYGSRVGVSACDTGYTGTPDVTYIECLASGDWSPVSGCMVGRCNSPSKVGYNLGTPTATTYGGTVRVVSCFAGYTGSPSVTELTCQDTGNWSDVTGCTISDQTNTVIALAVSLSLVTAILICVIVAFLIRERKREKNPSNNAGNASYEMPDQTAHQRPEDHYATLDVQSDGYEVPMSRSKF